MSPISPIAEAAYLKNRNGQGQAITFVWPSINSSSGLGEVVA